MAAKRTWLLLLLGLVLSALTGGVLSQQPETKASINLSPIELVPQRHARHLQQSARCTQINVPICRVLAPRDIIFLVDASDSIDPNRFYGQSTFRPMTNLFLRIY
jgi:hypothetical protein